MHRLNEDFNESLENGFIALRYLPYQDSLFRPLTYLEVAKVLYTLQNYALSLEYARKAMPYFEAVNDPFNIASALNSIGLAYINIDSAVDQSIASLKHAIEIHSLLGDSISFCEAQINLGIAYLMNEQFDSALFYFDFVEESNFLNTTMRYNIKPIVYTNKGLTLHKLGQSDEGLEYSLEGLKLAREANSDYIIERAAHTIKEIYLLRGDTTSAFKYQKIYIDAYQINSELSNDSRYFTLEKLTDEQIRLQEAEFSQRQLLEAAKYGKLHMQYLYLSLIASLVVLAVVFYLFQLTSKRKALLSKAHEKLSKLDESKNRLFSIIGHDLRGPIGNSVYLLNELHTNDDTLSGENREVIENIEQGLTQIQDLLENLLLWAKEEASEAELNRTDVNISDVLSHCKKMLAPLAKINKMEVKIDIDSSLQWSVDKNAYSTIIRNTMSNSLKYGDKSTLVEVTATREGNELVTRIIDRGEGIPEDIIQRYLNSTTYTNTTSNGMGLFLVSLFIRKHGGSFSYHHANSRGCLEIRIPKN